MMSNFISCFIALICIISDHNHMHNSILDGKCGFHSFTNDSNIQIILDDFQTKLEQEKYIWWARKTESWVGFARSSCFRAFGPFGLFWKLSGFRFGLSVPFLLRDLIKMCDIYFLALQIELSMLLYTEMKHHKEQLELRNPYQYLKYKFLLKCINSL